MPEGHAILPEVPAKQDEIAAFGMPRRKVDEPAVEVLHLHAGRLELGDEERDLARNLIDRTLGLLHARRIEPAAVACDLSLHLGEAPAAGHEAPACRYEPFDERRDHLQGVVRLLLAEELHTC